MEESIKKHADILIGQSSETCLLYSQSADTLEWKVKEEGLRVCYEL